MIYKFLVYLLSAFIFFVPHVSAGVLNLPQPHGYGIPKITDAINKEREKNWQERRQDQIRQEQYQQQLEYEQRMSDQQNESRLIELIIKKASTGKMTLNDKKYLEDHMGA